MGREPPKEWDCPTWGCRGILVADGEPRGGDVVWCRPRGGESHRHVCGRAMVWRIVEWVPGDEVRGRSRGT